MLWMSFILSVCSWPEVVPESGHSSTHTWYLAATGWVFALPKTYRKLDFLRDDFSQCFLRAPGIWQSLVQCVCSVPASPEVYRKIGIFWMRIGIFLRLLVSGSHSFDTGLAGGVQYADSSGT